MGTNEMKGLLHEMKGLLQAANAVLASADEEEDEAEEAGWGAVEIPRFLLAELRQEVAEAERWKQQQDRLDAMPPPPEDVKRREDLEWDLAAKHRLAVVQMTALRYVVVELDGVAQYGGRTVYTGQVAYRGRPGTGIATLRDCSQFIYRRFK